MKTMSLKTASDLERWIDSGEMTSAQRVNARSWASRRMMEARRKAGALEKTRRQERRQFWLREMNRCRMAIARLENADG